MKKKIAIFSIIILLIGIISLILGIKYNQKEKKNQGRFITPTVYFSGSVIMHWNPVRNFTP